MRQAWDPADKEAGWSVCSLCHGIARTLLLVFAHYAFPEQRFVIIPAIIVLIVI